MIDDVELPAVGPDAAEWGRAGVEPGEFDAVAITAAKEWSPRIVMFSTSLAVFAVFLDTTIGFVTFPAISSTFRAAGPSTVSWVLNAYTLVFAALLIPAGRLADRVGRRKMFLIGVIVFTTGSMMCGLAPSVGFLIAAEVLEAVGAAILVPASLALVLQTFPREKVPVAVAIWGAIGAAAGAAGPVLGALLVSNLSWRWAFYVNLPVGLLSFFLGRIVLPEGREAHPGPVPDPAGVVVLAGGVALVTYAIVETSSWGWASGRFGATMLAGLVLLGTFVYRC
ncbi:MAG TPA: MFS transporter, partial [Acidimicrobiales bacterium]